MDCMTGKEKKAVVTSPCLSFAVLPHHPVMHNPLYAFVWILWALIKLSVHMKSMLPVFPTAVLHGLVRLNNILV